MRNKSDLADTYFFDFKSDELADFISSFSHLKKSERVIQLYYAVRDEIRYNPFAIIFEPENLKASSVIVAREGHCVHKATLLISAYRALGIPARLRLARVRNHMGTSKFEQILRTDVLNPHGYVEVYLNEQWVKCTPAFNKSLCQKLGVEPLEFNGEEDSVFQAFDRDENGFMQYLTDHGSFSDVPIDFLKTTMQNEYPHLFNRQGEFRQELFR